MFETYMKKLLYLSPTIKQLPVTYIGNKYFNKEDESEPRVTNKMPYNPSCLINSIRANYYNKFKRVKPYDSIY
jgi:hypothetical protein